MQSLTAVLSARGSSVSIEDSVVCDLGFVVDVQELLDIRIIVFHVVSLADIADDASVVPFNHKLESSYSECIARLQVMILLLLKHFVESAAILPLHIQVAKHDGSADFVIVNFKMVVTDLGSLDLNEVLLLAYFLIV